MWKISFKNSKNEDCVITIKNGASDTDTTGTDLVPAADPLTLQMDDDDDVFKPVRLSSGNINILCDDMTTLQSIIAQNPLDRPVTLTIGGIAAWKGFVKSEAFDQTLFGCNEQFSIPVMSCLSALKGIYVNQTNWLDTVTTQGVTYFTQKQLMKWVIDLMNTMLGSPYTITYPNASPLLTNYVNKLNWVEEIRVPDVDKSFEAKLYEGKTYMDILEDIMKYCCLVVYERGATLDFNKPYKYLSTDTATALTTLSPKTTDHTASIILGKKSVSVQANANVQKGTILSLDDIIKRLSLTSVVRGQSDYLGDRGYIDMYECRFEDRDYMFFAVNSNLETTKTVVKDSTSYACAIEYEGRQTREGSDTTKNPSAFDFLNPAIVMHNMTSGSAHNAYISFYIALPREVADSPKYKISFQIETKGEGEGMKEWNKNTCQVYVQDHYNDESAAWSAVTCENGKFEKSYPSTLTAFTISANCPDNGWAYARITNFKIEYDSKYNDFYGIEAYDIKETYESKKEIGKGFDEEYSVELNLVSANVSKSTIPGSSTTRKLYGRGVVTNIYGSEFISSEESMCNLLYNYYQQSRVRLCIKIESSTYIDTNILYYNGDKKYHILAQELNVRDCILKLTLQEAYESAT